MTSFCISAWLILVKRKLKNVNANQKLLPLFWYFNITATYLIYTRTIGFLATIQCILMIVCSEMKVRTLVASYPKWKALYWHVQHQAIGCHKLCLNAFVSRNWSKNWTYLANSFLKILYSKQCHEIFPMFSYVLLVGAR